MTTDRFLLTLLLVASILSLCWLGRLAATTQRIEQAVRQVQ